MQRDWELTSWQGMQMQHPHDWELASVNEPGGGGRCAFFDRYAQRLDIQWQQVKDAPDLEKEIEDYRGEELPDPPEGWRGTAQRGEQVVVVRACRYFEQPRLLAEVTVRWPIERDPRDAEAERQILASIQPEPPSRPRQRWRALGLDLELRREFELTSADTSAGRIALTFQDEQKHPVTLTVARLSMVEYWLNAPLEQWLQRQLPRKPKHRVRDQKRRRMKGHQAEALYTRAKIDVFRYAAGYRNLRLDVAWQCEKERRLYHVTVEQRVRGKEIDLPESLSVTCCQDPPKVERKAPR
ncbi:MAG: hypothetical protein ACOC93_01245 [Planctomycetota bacterium]